jgi:hypothetical protein
MNISLLCKWWWKLDNEKGLWQDIVRYKFLRNGSVCTVSHRQLDSPMWSDLLKIRDIYLQGRRMHGKNGQRTLFWKDRWMFDQPLFQVYPNLFQMFLEQDITISQVKINSQSAIFSRWLVGGWKDDREHILLKLANAQLIDGVGTIT